MTVRRIVTPPDPVLRIRARKVRRFTPELRRLVDDMIETMRAAPGVGLAAPQVGVSQQIIVVEYGEEAEDPESNSKPPKLYVVANPEITRRSEEMVLAAEGCLSIPGYMGDVERHVWVTVKGLTRDGKLFKLKAKGWLARIFQHEIDHLEGVLFTDRAQTVWRMEEQEKAEASKTPSLG